MPVSSIKVLSTGQPFHLRPRNSGLILSRNVCEEGTFRGELVPQDPTSDEPASVLWSASTAERAAAPVKSNVGRSEFKQNGTSQVTLVKAVVTRPLFFCSAAG